MNLIIKREILNKKTKQAILRSKYFELLAGRITWKEFKDLEKEEKYNLKLNETKIK